MRSNWDLPGGLVEDGEDDIAALEREVEEETNLKAKIGRELGRWTFYRPFDSSTVEVTNYSVELDTSSIDDIILSPEHVAAKFVAKSLLPTLEVKDPSIFGALGQ
jgi:8-oxo-dGTP pyrophosphatase MutT (NUDIX family)